MQIEQLSIDLLLRLRKGEDCKELIKRLAQINPVELLSELSNDEKRKAFWINIYNAFIIIFLKSDPRMLDNQQHRYLLFHKKKLIIGNHKLSLNDIIHGILRHSKVWWAKGYLSKLFANRFEKKFRTQIFDNRIHFAINYGSKSSPPIRIYNSAEINHQLDLSANLFMDSEVRFFEEENIVTIPQIFNWYAADFEGKNGILSFLKKYEKIPWNSTPVIIYIPFSWMPEIGNFVNL